MDESDAVWCAAFGSAFSTIILQHEQYSYDCIESVLNDFRRSAGRKAAVIADNAMRLFLENKPKENTDARD